MLWVTSTLCMAPVKVQNELGACAVSYMTWHDILPASRVDGDGDWVLVLPFAVTDGSLSSVKASVKARQVGFQVVNPTCYWWFKSPMLLGQHLSRGLIA